METGRSTACEADEAHVDEEAPTLREVCRVCVARARVDEALVRAGATQITIVTRYDRPTVGLGPREQSSVLIAMPHGIVRGEGESREDAIAKALENAGVRL